MEDASAKSRDLSSSAIVKPEVRDSDKEKEEDLLTEVREDLAELFLWWYGKDVAMKVLKRSFNRQGRMILTTEHTESPPAITDKDIPVGCTEDCWQNKWFPVDEEHEKRVDEFLRERFGGLVDHDAPKYECVTNLQPDCLWEQLALIVLFDPVSRFVHRGTAQAFATEHKAQHFALELVKNDMAKAIPLHFASTVMICLCHSEDAAVQEVLGHLIRSQDFDDKYLVSHERIANALKLLYRDSLEKVDLFGRFPDRNKALNRQSTEEEEVWMANVVDRDADMKDMADSK